MSIIQEVRRYLKFCPHLLYTNPVIIKRETKNLQNKYVEFFGPDHTDKTSNFFINKKRSGYPAKTSGTTTGQPFHYFLDAEFYSYVEFEMHYLKVLKEFNINCKNILYGLRTNLQSFSVKEKFFVKKNLHPSVSSHGTTGTYTHFINWENDLNDTIKNIVNYAQNNKIDVILMDGATIKLLSNYIQKNNIKDKICTFLSNTNEALDISDSNYLKDNQNIEHWSDHMRCWDGGASFVTCKNYTYHLLENLSHVKDVNGKLISTDFFNLVHPFVNYWNGDYCTLGEEYKQCKCGMWYRDFKLTPRTFSVNNLTSEEIKARLKSLKIKGITQVICDNNVINIVGDIQDAQKSAIIEILPEFEVKITSS